MRVIKSDNVVYFDVDDTLVSFKSMNNNDSPVEISIKNGIPCLVFVHKLHVEQIKKHKAWGDTVVVWTKSSYKWAEAVIKTLELEKYVDLIISKPLFIYDDKRPEDFIKEIRYLTK